MFFLVLESAFDLLLWLFHFLKATIYGVPGGDGFVAGAQVI